MSERTNIAFKKGSYEAFQEALAKKSIQAGALYLTENEGCLYLGTGNNTVKRIQGSVVFYDTITDFTTLVEPPFSTDVIYYIVNDNALIHWNLTKTENEDGTFTPGWDQLNVSENDLAEFGATIAESLESFKSRLDTFDIQVGDFVTFEQLSGLDYATTEYVDGVQNTIIGTSTDDATVLTLHGLSKKITNVKSTADDAKSTADTAKTIAEGKLSTEGGTLTGHLSMSGKNITSLANPSAATDAANKSYVDAEIAKVVARSDALVFAGVLNKTNNQTLPTTANVGDTYKVGENGVYFGSATAKIGDLIICIELNDDNTPVWDIIPSGDELSYVQNIIATPADNTFYLTNGVDETVANALTGVKFVSDNDNIVLTTSNRTGNLYTVTASLVWGSF